MEIYVLTAVALFLGVAWLVTLRRAQASERARRDILTAFASRNDDLIGQLAVGLPADQQTLWRRLSTQRAALEEAQSEQGRARRDLEDVLASLQDAVLVVDAESRLRFVNEAALRLFGLRIEDVLGANLIEALPSFGIDAAMRAALQDGQSSAHEIHLYAPQLREVFLRVAPVYSGAGAKAGAEAGAVAIVQDMTELRRLERVRRDFVANASHELRTPIANIRATAETLLHAPDDARLIERFLPPLISEAERLSRLVSDLLNLARAEASEETARAPVELKLLVGNVVNSLSDKAARNEITIEWHSEETAPLVSGDAAALEQVAFNLLDNALSYTPRGGSVTLQLREQGDAAILEVRDSGIGIPRHRFAAHLRALLPRGQGALALRRRHRFGLGDRQTHRGKSRRPRRSRIGRRAGHPLSRRTAEAVKSGEFLAARKNCRSSPMRPNIENPHQSAPQRAQNIGAGCSRHAAAHH